MNSYDRAKVFVDIYEKHVQDILKPTGEEDLDEIRRYLIRDIRLVNAIMSGYSQIENADFEINHSLLEIINSHQTWREHYDRTILAENAYLSKQYSRSKGVFEKAANFYLVGAYTKYGIDEDTALELASKITGVSKEKLKDAKDKKIDPMDLEDYLEYRAECGNELYDFNTSTIYSEMETLLAKTNYENLDLNGKIKAIEESLKQYLITLIRHIRGGRDFFRDFEKTIEDLIELIAVHSNNSNNIWDIINYLVGIIGTFGKTYNIVLSNELEFYDEPCIDTERMTITIHQSTNQVVVFKSIYDRLFNLLYLEKGISLKKSQQANRFATM